MGLDMEDKSALKESIPELVQDTPKTGVAALRVKRLLAKAGAEAGSLLHDIIVDTISETARKVIWGGLTEVPNVLHLPARNRSPTRAPHSQVARNPQDNRKQI